MGERTHPYVHVSTCICTKKIVRNADASRVFINRGKEVSSYVQSRKMRVTSDDDILLDVRVTGGALPVCDASYKTGENLHQT